MMRLRALISFPTSLFLIALCLVTVNAVWYYPSCPKNGCQCVNSQPKGGGKQCCCVGKDIREIPVNLSTSMNTLLMSEVGIERISATDLLKYPLLEQIDISNAKALISVNAVAFDHLTKLRKLSLSDCPNLREIEGTLLEKNPKIQVLTVAYTALEQIPSMRMTNDHYLTMQSIDFSNNKIQNLTGGLIQRVYTKSFRLDNNQLTEIGSRVFNMCKFVDLNLSHNRKLTVMSKSAFEGISVIHNLNLSDTSISELPTEGIKELKSIDIRDTSSLKQLPSILAFTTLQEAKFTYPYHCCLFKHAKREAERSDRQYTKNLAEMQSKYCEKKTTSTPQAQKKEPLKRQRRQVTTKSTANAYLLFELDYFDRWGAYDNETVSSESEESSEEPDDHTEGQTITVSCHDDNAGIYLYYENITCTPEPNALNPCEDVVGYTFLRFAIWVVWIFAIVGNIGVWAVLIIVKHPRMKVHYFFMMNLALADLLTGVYLAMLAIQDIRTSGEYYNYAVEWQTGMGCKVAGFISVFASELSIITMFLISFEIWYNTKYVFYGKRLHQYAAWILMFLGYIYATLMAALPLLGVSSYSPTSICLPLKISSTVDRGYIISGLIFNIIAFCGMATNYGMIYCTMNGSASRSTRPEDIQVAKKMALLIGTDFLCWCPTILFGLTAALKMPLINISVAKIFLVLFYP
uniref:G-protein coupled receptors family 1 profile domain-containing protein n=1 Tax=Plectus sambesii TaxID=2011161 RepID=A0A914WTS2_9BILA